MEIYSGQWRLFRGIATFIGLSFLYDSMTILAAIDDTDQAMQIIDVAYDLAQAYQDELIVLHVIPEADYKSHREKLEEIPGFDEFSFGHELDNAAEIAQWFVAQSVAGEQDSVEVSTIGRVGDVADEIVREAGRTEARFLVIGGTRRSPVGKAVFGDTSQQIILRSDCPVVSNLQDQPES